MLDIYLYSIHPELRIFDCFFGPGKGAREAAREQGKMMREHLGAMHRGSRCELKMPLSLSCSFSIIQAASIT